MATEDKAVALTFDDGPTPVFTPQVLDLLDRYQAHATFFVIGGLLDDNASLIARMVQAGHEIGNHTWSHVSAALLDDAAARDQQQRGVEAIKRYTGRVPAWYRPPRGMLTGASIRIAHELGQHVAMWSVDRGPAADIDVDGVRQHLVSSLAPGAVIDLHDGVGSSGFEDPTNYDNSLVRRRETELAALPDLLHQAMDAGYRFVTMSELMGLPERR
jgi:peptidoglycan/xylan/chitin deacetylase (PgdA/CDA1 family)